MTLNCDQIGELQNHSYSILLLQKLFGLMDHKRVTHLISDDTPGCWRFHEQAIDLNTYILFILFHQT